VITGVKKNKILFLSKVWNWWSIWTFYSYEMLYASIWR